MPGVISGTCRKCRYRIDGLPADTDGSCTCPECGLVQSNPALRESAPSLKGDIGLVIVLSALFPIVVIYLGYGAETFARWGAVVWGFILSPLIGAVIGFINGRRISRWQTRADYRATKGKATSFCIIAGLATGLAGMILVTIVLVLSPAAENGWH